MALSVLLRTLWSDRRVVGLYFRHAAQTRAT